jgi:hypothetical protein
LNLIDDYLKENQEKEEVERPVSWLFLVVGGIVLGFNRD